MKPTLHKQRDEKVTLVILRNHKTYESMKATEICNDHWKPLQAHMTNEEAVHEHITNKLQKPTDETIKAFEESLESLKEKKRQSEIGNLDTPDERYPPDGEGY